MRTRFRADHQLTARMMWTVFLLGLVYVIFMVALIVIFGSWLWVVLIAGGLLIAQLWFSDRIALSAMRARVVTPEEMPRLHGFIDRLCATADMPKPRVAIIHDDMPNAFATGRSTRKAVVCVTTGLARLKGSELEGVLAHELSHIAHRDVVVMTVASFLGVLAGLITRFGWRRRINDQLYLLTLVAVAVSAVVYVVTFFLLRALSRYRELAADRAAAVLTGQPSALAAALTKVSNEISEIPTKDLRTAQAFNAFFFAPIIGKGSSLANLMSTHPTLERRLDQLAALSIELGEEVPGP